MQLLLTTCCCYCCLFELKDFVHALMLPLSPVNEDSNNPSMRTKRERDTSYKNFYYNYNLYNTKPARSTDQVVKEKLVKEKCHKNSNGTILCRPLVFNTESRRTVT